MDPVFWRRACRFQRPTVCAGVHGGHALFEGSLLRLPSDAAVIRRLRYASGALYSNPTLFQGGSMCDYSLAGLPNRLAIEGEQLVVYRFTTRAMGLTPSCPGLKQFLFSYSTPAVCIPPGARIRLH